MGFAKLVVVVPAELVYTEFTERYGTEVTFQQFKVVFTRRTESLFFTDKECCLVRVTAGMYLLDLDLAELQKRKAVVIIAV
ncbi:MAG: hypothetical protein NUW02_01540 [Candidatus Campbellbacteria bacterium]|nr:hypothetical protein [Candidatus Campbellbacteria bacterium]